MSWPLKVQGSDGKEHVFGPIALLLRDAIGACLGCGRTICLHNVPPDVAKLRSFGWPMQSKSFPHPLWSEERPPAVPAQVIYSNQLEREGWAGGSAYDR